MSDPKPACSQDYTPGPWSIVGATKVWKTGEDGAAVAIMAEPEIESSADFRPVEIYSARFDEACANACLIAAAPDLLAALRSFVNAAKSWHDFHHGSKTIQCDWLCECIPAGEAALNRAFQQDKVTGETK